VTSKEVRDLIVVMIPSSVAFALAVFGAQHVPPNLLMPLVCAIPLACGVAIKLFTPDNFILRQTPWWVLLTYGSCVLAGVTLISNFGLLGWWTLPVLLALAAILITTHVFLTFADKKDDGAPPSD